MVCQFGDTQVQMTFINGNQMSDETLTVAPSATGLCLFHGPVSKAWQDSTLVGHIANLRAPQIPNFETQVLLPAMGAARELGHQQGLITAERERLNFDYANAVADVQNRNAQLNSQFQEAHINLSVRESNIAGAGNQVLELRQQLEAARAQLREREFNLEGSLATSRNGRHALTHYKTRGMRRRWGGTMPPPRDALPTMA
ncbi:hypothetical protein TcBrA4_0032650 [Trypanosoma cruzi]|nr:hypothetical protein TcBrA4_0032650 [Trypanosoma cruzi]